jgi:hypothetical protein
MPTWTFIGILPEPDAHNACAPPESPDAEGEWSYTTASSASDLAGHTGRFTCIPPLVGAHVDLDLLGELIGIVERA